MTDEEMAEKYAIENWEHYEEGQTDYKALKQVFLAGLEAGEKRGFEKGVKSRLNTTTISDCPIKTGKDMHVSATWHKVADGDYPPCEKGNYTISVLTDKGDIAYYSYNYDCWIAEPSSGEIDPPEAWCMIPEYVEE